MATPHYSPFYTAGDFIFISGQLPLLDRESLKMPEGIVRQTQLVLQRTEDLLLPLGYDRRHIVKTTAFVADMNDWDLVNDVYADFFGDHKPARSVVPVPELHFGCLVEIESIACIHLSQF